MTVGAIVICINSVFIYSGRIRLPYAVDCTRAVEQGTGCWQAVGVLCGSWRVLITQRTARTAINHGTGSRADTLVSTAQTSQVVMEDFVEAIVAGLPHTVSMGCIKVTTGPANTPTLAVTIAVGLPCTDSRGCTGVTTGPVNNPTTGPANTLTGGP